MKLLLSLIFSVLLILPYSYAQDDHVSNHDATSFDVADISGTWVGTRKQFNRNATDFIAEFEYIFELQQEGSTVSGISYIKNGDENYAEIKIKGRVIGDKFHFQEYEIINERKPENKLWCYKIGELQFSFNESGIGLLFGQTNSYTSRYFTQCTGGITNLERIDDYNNSSQDISITNFPTQNEGQNNSAAFKLEIAPNPFVNYTTISYKLGADKNVNLTLYNIEGKVISILASGFQTKGNYNLQLNSDSYQLAPGVYIIEMIADGEVSSKQLVVSRY